MDVIIINGWDVIYLIAIVSFFIWLEDVTTKWGQKAGKK